MKPADKKELLTIADTIEANGGWRIAAVKIRGFVEDYEALAVSRDALVRAEGNIAQWTSPELKAMSAERDALAADSEARHQSCLVLMNSVTQYRARVAALEADVQWLREVLTAKRICIECGCNQEQCEKSHIACCPDCQHRKPTQSTERPQSETEAKHSVAALGQIIRSSGSENIVMKDGKRTETASKHTTEDDFQHWLTYSGNSARGSTIIEWLREAYFAGASVQVETRPECICPKCGLRHGGSNLDGGF